MRTVREGRGDDDEVGGRESSSFTGCFLYDVISEESVDAHSV